MTALYIVIGVLAYLGVGLVIGRGQYAREVYRRSLWSEHADGCYGHGEKDPYSTYARKACTCLFFKKEPPIENYVALVPFWFFWALWTVPEMIVTSGTYVPKEVKASQKLREAEELVAKFDARTEALEIAAGIRKEEEK